MEQWMISLYLFIVGLFFGSFFNCLCDRLSNNQSIIHPGSHCDNCKHELTWYELIPVFSYFFQGGKCSKCKIKLSFWYPFTEICTGLLFMGSFIVYGFSYETLLSIVISSVFICVIISDAKYMIILDEVLIAGIVLCSIIYLLQYGLVVVAYKFLNGLLLFSLFLLLKVFGDVTFKQESLGWGDIKLAFFVGIVLGVKLGILHIFMGAFLALPYALFVSYKKNDKILPFGPFLVSAFFIIFHFSDFFYNLITKLYSGGLL